MKNNNKFNIIALSVCRPYYKRLIIDTVSLDSFWFEYEIKMFLTCKGSYFCISGELRNYVRDAKMPMNANGNGRDSFIHTKPTRCPCLFFPLNLILKWNWRRCHLIVKKPSHLKCCLLSQRIMRIVLRLIGVCAASWVSATWGHVMPWVYLSRVSVKLRELQSDWMTTT